MQPTLAQSILAAHIADILPKVQHPPRGHIVAPWLSVGYGEHYSTYIFTWDHHHTALRLAHAGKPEFHRHLVDNLTHHQRPDGFTPSMVGAELGPRQLFPVYHAQPFLFQGAWVYLKLTNDTAWASDIYEKLSKYLAFFFVENAAPHGLLRWRVGWYGGIDNDVVHSFFLPDSTISCDLSSLVVMECQAAAAFANRLGRAADAAAWSARAASLSEAINRTLWHEAEETYAAHNLLDAAPMLRLGGLGLSGEIGRYAFHSSTNLMPLYAGVAPQERADRVIKRYLLSSEHFWSEHGIRSLSARSEYYNNARWGNPTRFGDHRRLTNSNWQGPVWFPTCFFMCQALSIYGYQSEARELARRIVRTMALGIEATGSMAENFHGDTGVPLYCKKFASWNVLGDTLEKSVAEQSWLNRPA